ncbi:hypothetical protein [Flavobacterium foetidum]|uniref:hypothetical protein n=1 Tax=Flavobacterium foetidum TaxID=2026681 RepID=UPI00107576E6|nr:hypothetical protein [Flavobacterium foetidum]KAF2513794.1 hypothetical protein E0W73_13280 [Flavobacterium foetidum]
MVQLVTWNNFVLMIYVLAIVLNGYSWFQYNKNVTLEQRKKEGWTSFYRVSTLLIIILFCQR